MHTAELNFSIFVIEYFGEIETGFEKTVACLSGAQMGLNHENTRGWESRDTLPLSDFISKRNLHCQNHYKISNLHIYPY